MTEALQLYIDKHLHAANISIPTGPTYLAGSTRADRLVKIWKLLYEVDDSRRTFKDFQEMILKNREEIGLPRVDSRTVKRYWKDCLAQGVLTQIDYASWSIDKDPVEDAPQLARGEARPDHRLSGAGERLPLRTLREIIYRALELHEDLRLAENGDRLIRYVQVALLNEGRKSAKGASIERIARMLRRQYPRAPGSRLGKESARRRDEGQAGNHDRQLRSERRMRELQREAFASQDRNP